MTAIRRRREAPTPVYLLEAVAAPCERTLVRGPLWEGVLNATPDDDVYGPSPIEALLAALAACVARNLRSVTDAGRVRFDRLDVRIAAERTDTPPAVTAVRLELAITTSASTERARRLVELALRDGTITRTLARATALEVALSINGRATEVTYAP